MKVARRPARAKYALVYTLASAAESADRTAGSGAVAISRQPGPSSAHTWSTGIAPASSVATRLASSSSSVAIVKADQQRLAAMTGAVANRRLVEAESSTMHSNSQATCADPRRRGELDHPLELEAGRELSQRRAEVGEEEGSVVCERVRRPESVSTTAAAEPAPPDRQTVSSGAHHWMASMKLQPSSKARAAADAPEPLLAHRARGVDEPEMHGAQSRVVQPFRDGAVLRRCARTRAARVSLVLGSQAARGDDLAGTAADAHEAQLAAIGSSCRWPRRFRRRSRGRVDEVGRGGAHDGELTPRRPLARRSGLPRVR